MKMMNKFLMTSALLLVANGTAFASEHPQLYNSSKGLGMGGAQLLYSTGGDQIFTNPALLAQKQDFEVDVLSLSLAYNADGYQTVQDAGSVDFKNSKELAAFMSSILGKHNFFEIQFQVPTVTMQNYGFGLLGQVDTTVEVNKPSSPTVEVVPVTNAIANFSYGRDIEKVAGLSVGVSLKHWTQMTLKEPINSSALSLTENDVNTDLNTNSTVTADLGLTMKTDFLDYGLVLRDVTSPTIGENEYKMTADLAVGINSELPSLGLPYRAEFDFVDVMRVRGADKDMFKRLNFGGEVDVMSWLTLRGGAHQGAPSFGVTMQFDNYIEFTYANWTEEIGAYPGQRPDKRTLMQFTFGF